MLKIIRRFMSHVSLMAGLCLIGYGPAKADPIADESPPAPSARYQAPEKDNEIYLHPTITLITAGSTKLPLVAALTLEHHLLDSKSFILQEEIAVGNFKPEDTVKVSQ